MKNYLNIRVVSSCHFLFKLGRNCRANQTQISCHLISGGQHMSWNRLVNKVLLEFILDCPYLNGNTTFTCQISKNFGFLILNEMLIKMWTKFDNKETMREKKLAIRSYFDNFIFNQMLIIMLILRVKMMMMIMII